MSETILITGAGLRVGRHLALSLAALGHRIVVHYRRSQTPAREVVDQILAEGGTAASVQADLACEEETQSLIARASDAIGGPITTLVNNASVFDYDDISSATRQTWDLHLDTNLRAPFVLTQQLAAALPEKMTGCVINIIDQRVWRLNPQFITYTLSKAGLWTLTQTMAQALAPRIRVNAIGPGPVLASIHQDDDSFSHEARNVLLGHGPSLDEIAQTVTFILQATSMTGQMIALDGGQHLAWETPDVAGSRLEE